MEKGKIIDVFIGLMVLASTVYIYQFAKTIETKIGVALFILIYLSIYVWLFRKVIHHSRRKGYNIGSMIVLILLLVFPARYELISLNKARVAEEEMARIEAEMVAEKARAKAEEERRAKFLHYH